MSRLGRRRSSLTVVAATLLALAVPAAAHAATYTVKTGDGICGGGDLACGGLVEAADGRRRRVTSSTSRRARTRRRTFTTNVRDQAAISASWSTARWSSPGGGVSKLSKVAVATGAGNAPAIYVSGGGGLELSDSIVVSPRRLRRLHHRRPREQDRAQRRSPRAARRQAPSRCWPGLTTARHRTSQVESSLVPLRRWRWDRRDHAHQRGRGPRRPPGRRHPLDAARQSPRPARRMASTSTRATHACSLRRHLGRSFHGHRLARVQNRAAIFPGMLGLGGRSSAGRRPR